MPENLYLYLPSNSSKLYFSDNSTSQFRTKLPKRLSLERYDVECGVSDIIFTKGAYTFTKPPVVAVCGVKILADGRYVMPWLPNSITLHRIYSSEMGLYFDLLARLAQIRVQERPGVTFSDDNIITVKPRIDRTKQIVYIPFFDNELLSLLGLRDFYLDNLFTSRIEGNEVLNAPAEKQLLMAINRNIFNGHYFHHMLQRKVPEIFVATHKFDLQNAHSYMFLETNIIEPNIVGDTLRKVLRIVDIPINAETGETIVKHYKNPIYFPVAVKDTDTIEISIKDSAGKVIPLVYGPLMLVLHLKLTQRHLFDIRSH